jgi:D-glycero-alpha-D-manno-heptose-7-phosphate kinase
VIISSTPLRMSFVGGGSDIPSFYRKFGGAVVSTAIDKYVYVTVNKKFDDSIRLSYSITEEVSSAKDVKHPIVREALSMAGIEGGLEITSIADIPSRGSGLGSSSSYAVGLLNALYAHTGRVLSAESLGQSSCEIEIDRLKEPIGKQDQYAAAYGGLNYIQFNEDDSVNVSRIICAKETKRALESSIVVFYTGLLRSASDVLRSQNEQTIADSRKQDVLKRMVRFAAEFKTLLESNDIDSFGPLLHENWMLKKSLSEKVSSSEIDRWYDKALKAGATGGKLLGAGSGGFMMFVAPPELHGSIEKALAPLKRIPFAFENQGSRIIFVH